MFFRLCAEVFVLTLSCRLFYIRILVNTMDPQIHAQLFVIVVIYLGLIACSMVFRNETDNGSD